MEEIGIVDLSRDGQLLISKPVGLDETFWSRIVEQLAIASDSVQDKSVTIALGRTRIVERILASGPAAAVDWQWTRRAAAAAAWDGSVQESLKIALRYEPTPADLETLEASLLSSGFTRELRSFQLNATSRFVRAGRGADFSVPGSGKTTVAYATWSAMLESGSIQGMVVVAPPSAFEAWEREPTVCFAPNSVPRVRIRPIVLSSSDQIVVLNYERLSDVETLMSLRSWVRNRKILTVFDEAHRAKAGAASRRGSAAAELARMGNASVVLTGTPMPNKRSDLVSVLDLAWPGCGHRLVMGDLEQRLQRAFIRVTKADLALPRMNIRIEKIRLDSNHQKLYNAMIGQVAAWSTEADVTASEAGRALLRLIAATANPAAIFAPGAPWSLRQDADSDAAIEAIITDPMKHLRHTKIRRAAQIVAENRSEGRKTLVWSSFVDSVRLLADALTEHEPAVITGSTPLEDSGASSDRVREIERFRGDSLCWVLVATPQTLGEGVSLHNTCTDQVHLDRGYNAGTWLQAIDRTHRLGLPDNARVTCTVLEAQDTIDVRVSEVLRSKVSAMADALEDHGLRPVADPTIIPEDASSAILGDIDALRELTVVRSRSSDRREY